MQNLNLSTIEAKLERLVTALEAKRTEKRYLTAKEVGALTGLDHRTILNRSALDPADPRFIPSIRFETKRKYFEKKVIERIFNGRI
jgi:hypothetical protein